MRDGERDGALAARWTANAAAPIAGVTAVGGGGGGGGGADRDRGGHGGAAVSGGVTAAPPRNVSWESFGSGSSGGSQLSGGGSAANPMVLPGGMGVWAAPGTATSAGGTASAGFPGLGWRMGADGHRALSDAAPHPEDGAGPEALAWRSMRSGSGAGASALPEDHRRETGAYWPTAAAFLPQMYDDAAKASLPTGDASAYTASLPATAKRSAGANGSSARDTRLPRRSASFASLHVGATVPSPAPPTSPVPSLLESSARLVLEELKREKALLEPLREQVPRVWFMLGAEVHRVSKILRQSSAPSQLESYGAARSTSHPQLGLAAERNVGGLLPRSPSHGGLLSGDPVRYDDSDGIDAYRLQEMTRFLERDMYLGGAIEAAAPLTPVAEHCGEMPKRGALGRVPSASALASASAHAVNSGDQHDHVGGTRPIVRKRCRIPVPTDQYPDFNFVGRLLGPRGATLKKLENETGCKIMIRGRGSIRKDKEAEVMGKPGWEHVFSEPLHVILEAEMEEDAADEALRRARESLELLLVPVPEELDTLKRQQLRELAILNGTFRGSVSDSALGWPTPTPLPTSSSAVALGGAPLESGPANAPGSGGHARRLRRSFSLASGHAGGGTAAVPEYTPFGSGLELPELNPPPPSRPEN